MVILAVDYGDTRTGIAVCDKNEVLASPATTVCEKDAARLAEQIASLCREYGAEAVVIGLPRNMDGSYGFRCDACRALGQALQSVCDLPVFFEDERLTTMMAHNYLNAADRRGKKRKAVVDSLSAVLILESFLERRKHQADLS